MPYDIQLPDGTLVDNIPDDIDPVAAKAKILQKYPELALGEKKTLGQVGKDVLAGVGSGLGSLAQFPGQVYGLVTGDMDQGGLQQLGRNLQQYSEEAKSPIQRAKESARSQKIAQTEGVFNQAGVAILETLKDPALLSSFIFEQAPQLLGTMGGGYITKQGVKALMRNATEEVLAKSGVRGAVGTGALMQGADIGTDTYERIFNERMMQGYPEAQAREEALAGGRQAAVEAAAISGLTSFGAGSTIERALTRGAAAGPKKGIIRGALGETLSEAVEEGGGKLASNIEFQKVKPESDIFEGVGAAIGMGALGGGLFGLPSSIVNSADANQIERAKAQMEEAKRKAKEENKPQEVLLQIGYDPNVQGKVINTPIIVNPDGTTIFPSERNQFAQVVPNELSEEGMSEKYGIRTPEQIKAQTFSPETIKGFGINPKANIYKNKDVLNADLADPAQAEKVKGALEDYLKKYPKASPEIRGKVISYLLRQEFHPAPKAPTEITEASITPQADQAAVQQRLLEGFKNRPEIKKIYDDYNKMMQEGDVDKAALSAFNNIVTPQVIKSFGIPTNSSVYGDQELINADLSNPETADRIRAKLMEIQKQTKSAKIKENIDKYLNRSEFITPAYVNQFMQGNKAITPSYAEEFFTPEEAKSQENLDHFVFVNDKGEIESKYGTIVEKDGKKYAKYPNNKFQKGGDRELNENVLVNPKSPDQIELMALYKAKEKLEREPDNFKSWLISKGVDPKERSDIAIESRLPHKMFRSGGFKLDDLVRMAIEEGILHEPDFQEGIGGVESMRRYIKMAVDKDFVPTSNNMRNMNDLENLQQHIENLENVVKGTPEEAIAQEFRGEEAPVATPLPTTPPAATVEGIPSITEEKPKVTQNKVIGELPQLNTTGLKVPKGRHPQVVAAGKLFQQGDMSREVFNKYVEKYMPIEEVSADKLRPPTHFENILTFFSSKGDAYKDRVLKKIPDGTRVGLRMDLPALQSGLPVVSIHEGKPNTNSKTGKPYASAGDVIKYDSTGYLKGNVEFAPRDQEKSLNMGLNPEKNPLQTIEGDWQNLDPEQVYRRVKTLMNRPEWKQIGFDPARHGYFYDRSNGEPVASASEVYQIGNFVLAKDVEYAPKEEFLYSKSTMEAKATPEQKKASQAVADTRHGGEVVWQDGDLALIRTFTHLNEPVYIPAKGYDYINKNINKFDKTQKDSIDIKDVKNTPITQADIDILIKAKNKLEKNRLKAEEKYKDFVKFNQDGVSLSKDIDPKLAGVISEWKKLFGLKNNIYISTTEDAIENRDKFVGPYARIQSATFDKNENGVTQLLSNGERYILFQRSTSMSKMLETIAHEMGHAHEQEIYRNASPEIKKQLRDEHQKWLAKQKTATARELLQNLRAKKTAETTRLPNENIMAKDLDRFDTYWTSFSEWYADNVARWATTSEKPLSVVERFFANIANGLRKIFGMIKNRGYLPNETFKQYMDTITKTEAVRNNPILPMSVEDQQPLFSRSTMKASFEGVDESYADAIRKQFTQEEATVSEKFKNLKSNFFEKMVTGVFDEFRAIKKYTTEGYMMARLSKSIDGGLQGLLEHGQVYIKDGALDIRPNTKGLLEILEPLGAEVDQYQIWKALSRDAQMPADKRSFDAALVAGRDNLTKGTIDGKSRKEVYEKARLEENQLNRSVLDVALQSGLIDRQAYQVFSNDINYIPFYKKMEDGDVDSVNASSKLTGQYFSKALKGGEKKTNDLMENVLLNWSHILSASMKNQAAFKTIKAAESMDAAVKAKPMDGKYPPNTIKVMEEGKITHYTLEDPDLVDAISTISYLGPKSAFLDVAKGFTNALRYGITLSPAYKVRNLIRDSLQSASVSELGLNMFDNVYNGLKMTKKGDPTFMSALAGGGIFEMGTAHEGDQAKLIKRLIDKGVKEATILDTPDKIKGKLQDLLNSYNELGNKFENANRLALYKKLIDSGKSHLEASYAARDLMDFSMQGQFRAIKVIGSVVPFFNARLQGLYKLGRDGITPTYRVICNATTGAELRIGDKEKAQRFATMTSAIALASILLYGAYKDDEDFQRREGWDRDNFWWFKIGDIQFRIPKPFEIGAVGTIAERTYEQIADDSVEGKVFGERLNHILMDTFSLNPMPQMIKPLIDLYANKDSFTSAPIESAGMERLSKQERLNNKTSGVAIALGGISEGAAKILTFNPDAQGFSPVQMDYAIKAYLGWLGATAVSTADLAVEPFTEGTRVRPPVIDTLAMGFIKTEPQTQSKYMTQFYENNARLQSALADMRHYAELGDMEKVAKIMEEKGDDIALSKVYDKATKQLAQLRKQSRMIEQMKDMSTDDKRAEMNRIKILMSDIAKEMESVRKSR